MKVPMLLKNKYILYSLLLIGVVNVLGYIALEDYNSMALIIVLGVLSSYFSKNMSVNLLIAIIGTSLVAIDNKITEGFVEGARGAREARARPRRSVNEAKKTEAKEVGAKEVGAKKVEVKKVVQRGVKESKPSLGDSQRKKKTTQDNDKRIKISTTQRPTQRSEENDGAKSFKGCKNIGKTCPRGKKCTLQSQCVQGFQNNVPPSSPAYVDGTEETDESIGERIDYASTMEQAYDNLQQMLGEGGMKGLTLETKKLVSQQKNLMSTLNSMAPVLNTAKETLEGMNLPDMGEITTLMKKFTGGGSKKEKKKV